MVDPSSIEEDLLDPQKTPLQYHHIFVILRPNFHHQLRRNSPWGALLGAKAIVAAIMAKRVTIWKDFMVAVLKVLKADFELKEVGDDCRGGRMLRRNSFLFVLRESY
jgi:hypothetical protein